MTTFRRFVTTMEYPKVIWDAVAARELAWECVRARCHRDIRDQGYRLLDPRMVPAALSEVQVVEYARRAGGTVTAGQPARVPCYDTEADTVLLTLGVWCLPDADSAATARTPEAGHEG